MQQRETWLYKSRFCKWKCSATGDLSNLCFVQSERWPFMRSLKARFCFAYVLFATLCARDYMDDIFRFALCLPLDFHWHSWGWLSNLGWCHQLARNAHFTTRLWLPCRPIITGVWVELFVNKNISKRFGLLYAIMGFWGKIFFKRFEDSMIGQYLFAISLT